MDMNISDSADLVTITLVGPSTVYYSVGFGSTKMKNVWSIVVPGVDEDDDSVIEYILGDDSAGSQLDTSFTTVYDSTEDSMRTVTITRSLSDQDNLSSDYYEFSTDTSKESVVWAYGKKSYYSKHDESAAGSLTVKFSVTEEVSDDTTSLKEKETELFSSDLSYFYGQSRVSLIIVLALLSSILVYAAFHCYLKNKSMVKMVADEHQPLMDDSRVQDGIRIV